MKVDKITPSLIEDYIASEHFFTANDGREGALQAQTYEGVEKPQAGDADLLPLKLLTFCVLVLKNGFTVHGVSACADPANFNAEMGRKVARANAVNAIWPLMGYALRSHMAGMTGFLDTAPANYQDRARSELDELKEKLDKLSAFIQGPGYQVLAPVDKRSLCDQRDAMAEYYEILESRVKRFGVTNSAVKSEVTV